MGRDDADTSPDRVTDAGKPRAGEGPEWDRRHPDFEPGNTVAVSHGATSPRLVDPVAQAIKQEILADPELPDYLHLAQFRYALDAYCWAEAQCMKIREWVSRLELSAALEERTEAEEDEKRWEGGSKRKSVTRRIEAAHETARKYELLAANQRAKLGLDPASAAKLGRNLAARNLDIAQLMAQLAAEETSGNRNP